MAEAAKTIKQLVCEHEEALNGNGKPGIKTDLELIKSKVGDLWKLMWVMIGAIALEIILRYV